MEEYKANSHRSKEEQKQNEKKEIKPVVSGKVSTKKNVGRKLSDTFISEDVNNVKSYIWFDVLVPAIKKSLSDIIVNSVDMILYGESGRSDRKRSASDTISYTRYYGEKDRDRYSSRSSRSTYSYDDITIDSRREAEDVLNAMFDILDNYQIVSVADLYELVGVPTRPQDHRYGWDNLRNSDVVRVRDGYMLKLPKAVPIK